MEYNGTMFNPIQLFLLKMFERNNSEAELLEVKKVLADYYAKKLDAHMDALWDAGILDQTRLDEINEMDLHQWLREQKARENETE